MVVVGDRNIPWKEGMTVATVLAVIGEEHLCAVVRLNGQVVSRPKFSETPVPDGSELVPLPMVAGG